MASRRRLKSHNKAITSSDEDEPSDSSHGPRQVSIASSLPITTKKKPYKISSHTMMSIMRRDSHEAERYYHPRPRAERPLGPPHMRSDRIGRGLEIYPGKLCEFCNNLNLEDLLAGGKSDKHFDEGFFNDTQGHHRLPSQLEKSAVRCPLCRLFFHGMDSRWRTLMQLTKPEPVAPHWGQCRFKIWAWNGDYNRHTPADTDLRYLVLQWCGYGTDACAEVLLTARQGSEAAEFGGVAEDVTAPLIDGLTSSRTWNLISELWETCATTHENCQFGQMSRWQRPLQQHVPLPTRVIVADSRCPRLLETKGQLGVYAAMSHCWGETHSVKTTRLNYEDHKRRIYLSPVFPTFLDAVRVCEFLSIPYLWIDTLCIIQHDPTDPQSTDQDFLNEAGSMGSIYSRATLTIAATGASDVPTQGLFGGERDRLRQLVELPFRYAFDEEPMGVMYASPVPKDYVQEVSDSRLFTRGWVLQERLMSSRYLHFGREQWFWQCRQTTVAESDGLREVTGATTGADLGLVQGLLGGAEKFHYWWCRVVQIYTELDFLYPRDKIIALQGLMNELSRLSLHQRSWGLAKQHIWGIWKESLHVELMWFPVHDNADQMASIHGSVASHLQTKNVRMAQPRTFSWSWLSSTHPVKFPTRAGKSTSRESGRSIAYPGGTLSRRTESFKFTFRTQQELNAARTPQQPPAPKATKAAIWNEVLIVSGQVKEVTISPISPQKSSASSLKRPTGLTAAARLGPLAALLGANIGGAVYDHHIYDPAATSASNPGQNAPPHIGFCRLDYPDSTNTSSTLPAATAAAALNTSSTLNKPLYPNPSTARIAADAAAATTTTTADRPSPANPPFSANAADTTTTTTTTSTPTSVPTTNTAATPTATATPPNPRIFLLHVSDNVITEPGMQWRQTHRECKGEVSGMIISHNVLVLRKKQDRVYERLGIGVILKGFVGWFDGSGTGQHGPTSFFFA